MGLEVETVGKGERAKAVADYVKMNDGAVPDGEESWEDWLQTRRVELNAMSTPAFIAWLDAKMTEHGAGKLVPPAAVLAAELAKRIEDNVRATLTERILREAGLDRRVAVAIRKIKKPTAAALAKGIRQSFKQQLDREWRDHIKAEARKRTASI